MKNKMYTNKKRTVFIILSVLLLLLLVVGIVCMVYTLYYSFEIGILLGFGFDIEEIVDILLKK